MTRFVLVLVLVFSSTGTLAFDWPWKDTPEPRVDYCRGFLTTSLGAFPVEGLSRTRLWLAWNEVVKATAPSFDTLGQEFVAGKEFFTTMLESDNAQAIIDEADGPCALGTG